LGSSTIHCRFASLCSHATHLSSSRTHPPALLLTRRRARAPLRQVLRSDILYDCGNSLNPVIDVGQAEGAFVMGQGYFMQEEILQGFDGVLASEDTWEHEPGLLTC
jgi:hypothetical protein